jgi:hypothetical protein
MTEDILQEAQEMPVKLAFILDGNVVDVLHTDERVATMFLSEPIIVEVTGLDGTPTAKIGYNYHPATGNFFGNKPYESWIFDEELGIWKAPIECPIDGKSYFWHEEESSWAVQA